jgi:hypothetical protein
VYEKSGAGDLRAGAHWPCALDQSCSRYSDSLAIDTSHVCVLVRAAKLLADDDTRLADRFRDLLVSHTCSGQHRLMTSRTLLSTDSEMNLASPSSAPQLYGDLPSNSLDVVDSVDGGSGDDLPIGTPGDRDRTLVAAAVSVMKEGQETVMVVTDDEALAESLELRLTWGM